MIIVTYHSSYMIVDMYRTSNGASIQSTKSFDVLLTFYPEWVAKVLWAGKVARVVRVPWVARLARLTRMERVARMVSVARLSLAGW